MKVILVINYLSSPYTLYNSSIALENTLSNIKSPRDCSTSLLLVYPVNKCVYVCMLVCGCECANVWVYYS